MTAVAAILVAIGLGAGFGIAKFEGSGPASSASGSGEKKIAYWVAPMDPNFRRDKPGKSPMGMDLIPVYEGEAPGSGGNDEKAITIDSAIVNNLGVRTTAAKRSDLSREINTIGFLMPNERMMSHTHVYSEGWIEELTVKAEGDEVKKGDVLFRYYSRPLVNAQAEYVQALKLGQRTLQDAAKARLRSLGMSDAQIEDIRDDKDLKNQVDVLAPQNGYVTSLKVREGMFVQPNMLVLSLTDLSSIWVIVEIYEDQANWVTAGQKAEMTLQYLPGKIWAGTVDYVYPTVDPKSRTVRVRLVFDNKDGLLKPNMYADIVVHASPHEDVVSVPRESLIRAGGMERVILSLGEGRFRPAQVVAGIESGGRVEIINGLKEGEMVVTSGQFLIDSEASLDASLLRMTEPEMPKKDPDDLISGKGVVNKINLADRKINLTHEPIEEIGWPSMTMDFRAADNVELDTIKPGQSLSFEIQKDMAAGDYVVKSIGDVANGAKGSDEITASGVINAIKPAGREVNLTHQPIEAIGWPQMTMDFAVGSGVNLEDHIEGERVSFVLKKDAKSERYVIVSMSKRAAAEVDTAK